MRTLGGLWAVPFAKTASSRVTPVTVAVANDVVPNALIKGNTLVVEK